MVLDNAGTNLVRNKTPELDKVQAKTRRVPDKLLKFDLKPQERGRVPEFRTGHRRSLGTR